MKRCGTLSLVVGHLPSPPLIRSGHIEPFVRLASWREEKDMARKARGKKGEHPGRNGIPMSGGAAVRSIGVVLRLFGSPTKNLRRRVCRER